MTNKITNTLNWLIDIFSRNNVKFRIWWWFAVNLYWWNRPTADIDIDLFEEDIIKILPEIKEYITFWFWNYTDEEWDLNMVTLNYNWQEVDLCWIENVKIFNRNNWKFEELHTDLSELNYIVFQWLNLPVMKKEELIEYKSKVLRNVDIEDLKFLKSLN